MKKGMVTRKGFQALRSRRSKYPRYKSIRQENPIRRQRYRFLAPNDYKIKEGRRLKKQLNVLDFTKMIRQLRGFGAIVFTGSNLLFQAALPLTIKPRLVFVFALSDVCSAIPLIMQSPGRPDRRLTKDAAH